jgi:hypothetical protein
LVDEIVAIKLRKLRERNVIRFVLAALVVGLSTPGLAQDLFGNPFAGAASYRSERGDLSDARYRVRYEVTQVQRGGDAQTREVTIDVADDWALFRNGDLVTLYDYRLNRVFTLGGGSFTTTNGMADVTFRVMERQNRAYLQRVTDVAANRSEFPDACDAESELGLVIPGAAAGQTEFRENRGVVSLRCGGREIGSVTLGDGAAAPAAFWPTMYRALVTHPVLHRRARESGRAPRQIQITFREVGGVSTRSWRLAAVETVSVPYPLDSSLQNTTTAVMDLLVPGAGQIGADAVAGRALSGAPTLESWDDHLRSLSRNEGEAAAAMLVNPTFNMFPEVGCDSGRQYVLCDLVRNIRTLSDPAPWAVIEVGMAEQQGDSAAAIAAMQRAQASPHRDHPALGAAFALAILRFDDNALAQARSAGVPLDIDTLQNRALLAMPYTVAYWTDVGDRFGRNYEWPSAFLFYDVAYSLPMPSAVANNRALADKRRQMQRIRTDFSDAFLPASP